MLVDLDKTHTHSHIEMEFYVLQVARLIIRAVHSNRIISIILRLLQQQLSFLFSFFVF